jgi:hypothetical protein
MTKYKTLNAKNVVLCLSCSEFKLKIYFNTRMRRRLGMTKTRRDMHLEALRVLRVLLGDPAYKVRILILIYKVVILT